MNAAIPNPYLNPTEHLATALPRLLQLVPPAMPETVPINLIEAQLADAIGVQALPGEITNVARRSDRCRVRFPPLRISFRCGFL